MPYLEDFEMALTPVGSGRRVQSSNRTEASPKKWFTWKGGGSHLEKKIPFFKETVISRKRWILMDSSHWLLFEGKREISKETMIFRFQLLVFGKRSVWRGGVVGQTNLGGSDNYLVHKKTLSSSSSSSYRSQNNDASETWNFHKFPKWFVFKRYTSWALHSPKVQKSLELHGICWNCWGVQCNDFCRIN